MVDTSFAPRDSPKPSKTKLAMSPSFTGHGGGGGYSFVDCLSHLTIDQYTFNPSNDLVLVYNPLFFARFCLMLNIGRSNLHLISAKIYRHALEYLQPVRAKCGAFFFTPAWNKPEYLKNKIKARPVKIDTSFTRRDSPRPSKTKLAMYPSFTGHGGGGGYSFVDRLSHLTIDHHTFNPSNDLVLV